MKLIIINGPCGIGKSTLSAKMHANMPLSFLLDIDAQRRCISQYREQKEESGEMIRIISNSIIKGCLEARCDVIIDKMTYDPRIIDSYYEIAKNYGVRVYEIILWAPKDAVMKRANERGWREHGLLTPEKCELFWDKIDEFKENRPQAHIINIENITENEVYSKIAKTVK